MVQARVNGWTFRPRAGSAYIQRRINMSATQTEARNREPGQGHPVITNSNNRTLEAIFRHPSAHNLEWTDVVALIRKIGEVDEKTNSEFAFHVGSELHLMRKSHSKDLTGPEVIGLRKFLLDAGWSEHGPLEPVAHEAAFAASLLVVVDHHEARIYHIDLGSDDPSTHTIKPYDPHHFLHHLAHKGQSRERGQRAPEDESFYRRIAEGLANGGGIVVVGHGTGKSNAAHHLIDYLRSHDRGTYERIAREVVADFSGMTPAQLLDLARDTPG
jgi:hypothetical protein